jgi:hypothetical protein
LIESTTRQTVRISATREWGHTMLFPCRSNALANMMQRPYVPTRQNRDRYPLQLRAGHSMGQETSQRIEGAQSDMKGRRGRHPREHLRSRSGFGVGESSGYQQQPAGSKRSCNPCATQLRVLAGTSKPRDWREELSENRGAPSGIRTC